MDGQGIADKSAGENPEKKLLEIIEKTKQEAGIGAPVKAEQVKAMKKKGPSPFSPSVLKERIGSFGRS